MYSGRTQVHEANSRNAIHERRSRLEDINRLKPSGQLNIQQFYLLPTQSIYVFCVDLKTNSDHFHIQH